MNLKFTAARAEEGAVYERLRQFVLSFKTDKTGMVIWVQFC
jgi:hypothetical protein